MATNHSKKYSWHPIHRPPPADPSLAGRIAALGPVGKCLETALDELLAEDNNNMIDGDTNDQGNDDGTTSDEKLDGSDDGDGSTEKRPKKRRRQYAGTDGSKASEQEKEDDGSASSFKLDESISKSIMEAYGKSVAATKFDRASKKTATAQYQSTTKAANNRSTRTDGGNNNNNNNGNNDDDADINKNAPAAMLAGEIDHFNRVGGQWRIVIKNATIKKRSLGKVGNGKTGRRRRARTVLDWDDWDGNDDDYDNNGNSNNDDADDDAHSEKKRTSPTDDGGSEDNDVYHFPGTMQILAYDDDT